MFASVLLIFIVLFRRVKLYLIMYKILRNWFVYRHIMDLIISSKNKKNKLLNTEKNIPNITILKFEIYFIKTIFKYFTMFYIFSTINGT